MKTENNSSGPDSRGIFKQTSTIHICLDSEGNESSDIDTFDGDELKKILQRSAKEKNIISDKAEEAEEAYSDWTLLIPLFALSVIAGVTLTLATFRLFYSRFL